jgi:nucleotide-binding universal stress UspA family protein
MGTAAEKTGLVEREDEMSDQPEALRLADELDDLNAGRNYDTPLTEAAAELRRLHVEVERLREALEWIATHDLHGADLTVCGHVAHGFIGKARDALKETK